MYTFNSNVLDPTQFNPDLIGPTLSSTGVEYISAGSLITSAPVVLSVAGATTTGGISTIGLAFNKQTNIYTSITAVPALLNTDVNVVSFALDTTILTIPKALDNTVMSLIKQTSPSRLTYVTFTYLSAPTSSAFVSLCSLDQNVSTPQDRRLRYLGYNA